MTGSPEASVVFRFPSGEMTRLLRYIERKPPGPSVFALVAGLPVLGRAALPAYSGSPMQLTFDWGPAFCAACFFRLSVRSREPDQAGEAGLSDQPE